MFRSSPLKSIARSARVGGLATALLACSGGGGAELPVDAGADIRGDAASPPAGELIPGVPGVRVGTPDEVTGLAFEPLKALGAVQVRSGGQGGSHALVAFECTGLGNRINYYVRLEQLNGEGFVETAPKPSLTPIKCFADGICKVAPIFVVLGGLAPPEQWDGMQVKITVYVEGEDGGKAEAEVLGTLDRG